MVFRPSHLSERLTLPPLVEASLVLMLFIKQSAKYKPIELNIDVTILGIFLLISGGLLPQLQKRFSYETAANNSISDRGWYYWY